MAETFYGTWYVDIVGRETAYSQRIIVSGSDRTDGIYAANLATPRLHVSGQEWTLTMEWNDNVISGWQPSRMRRQEVTFTLQNGLVVVLGVDDNLPPLADGDFNDIVVRCQNIDKELIPWYPFVQTVDFSLPKRRDNEGQQSCEVDHRSVDKGDSSHASVNRRDL